MNEDFLVSGGGALKSLSDSGKVGGFLVLFDDVDIQQEFFTRSTDFWLEGKSLLPLIFDHGRSRIFGRKKLTHVRTDVQDQGVWIEGRLPIRDSTAIEQLWQAVQRDELGLSSGSSSHLVERVKRGSANEIVTWPISEASLAPAPAQPKSRAVALKSLPLSEFEPLSPEQRAKQMYAECLIRGHNLKMQRLQSREEEDKAEMRDYYNAIARIR